MNSVPTAVDLADEAHDELRRRMLVERARRTSLLDLALVHDDDLLGDVHRLLLVVGDEDRRDVDLVVETAEPLAKLLADGRVERTERLVEKEDARLDRERPGKCHPLALAAGELRRVAARQALEVHQTEELVDAPLDLGLRLLADGQPEADVLADGHVLERGVVLEHEANAAILDRQGRGVAPLDHNPARVRLLEPGDDVAGASTSRCRSGRGGP